MPNYEAMKRLAHSPLLRGNDATLLVDGEATFASIFAGLAQAEHYALVQFYIIHADGRRSEPAVLADGGDEPHTRSSAGGSAIIGISRPGAHAVDSTGSGDAVADPNRWGGGEPADADRNLRERGRSRRNVGLSDAGRCHRRRR